MTGTEFIRRVRRLGRDCGIPVRVDSKRGKGGHEALYYGHRFTIVRNPRDELKKGALHGMLRDLGLKRDDLT